MPKPGDQLARRHDPVDRPDALAASHRRGVVHANLKPSNVFLTTDGHVKLLELGAAGFRVWKPLVWDKCTIGMGYHYRSRYELILFFEKGKRKLADLGISDVIAEKRIHKGYPTEKPVRVNEILISQSSAVGEIVIDRNTITTRDQHAIRDLVEEGGQARAFRVQG